MANYLRHNKRAELRQERQTKRTQQTTTASHNECPYCLSRSLEHHGNNKFCRNCHRYI